MRSKCRCLALMHGVMFGESQTTTGSQHKDFKPTVKLVVEGWWFRFDLQPPCHKWVTYELLCMTKCSLVKCEAVCPSAKAWPKLGHTTGQWSHVHQKTFNWTVEKEKNQSVTMDWLVHCNTGLISNTDWKVCWDLTTNMYKP